MSQPGPSRVSLNLLRDDLDLGPGLDRILGRRHDWGQEARVGLLAITISGRIVFQDLAAQCALIGERHFAGRDREANGLGRGLGILLSERDRKSHCELPLDQRDACLEFGADLDRLRAGEGETRRHALFVDRRRLRVCVVDAPDILEIG